MTPRYDVLVIGGGCNGLAAAATLARGGRKVAVLERSERFGGLAALDEFHPGHRAPLVLDDTTCVRRRAVAALELERFGLRFHDHPEPVLAAEPGAQGVVLAPRDAAGLAAHGSPDAAAWLGYWRFVDHLAPLARGILDEKPLALRPRRVADFASLAGKGLALRRLPPELLRETARMLPMAVADFMNERFATDLVKGHLAARALDHQFAGPWSPGTTMPLVAGACAAGNGVRGGAAALVNALEQACRARGVDLRAGTAVARVAMHRGAAAGILLSDGSEVAADAVLSTLDPATTLLDLCPAPHVGIELARAARNWRARGVAARLDLALDGPFPFPAGSRSRPLAVMRTGGTLDDLERAFDAAKYGRCSSRPLLHVRVPTVESPELAPPGRHVACVLAQFAPYDLDGGWSDAARASLQQAILSVLEEHAPGVTRRVTAMRLLAPPDIETLVGARGGHAHHGELTLDQALHLRPHHRCSSYATPIPGLWLGGSGSHPGGGLTCAPGWLAARALLETARR